MNSTHLWHFGKAKFAVNLLTVRVLREDRQDITVLLLQMRITIVMVNQLVIGLKQKVYMVLSIELHPQKTNQNTHFTIFMSNAAQLMDMRM